MQSFRERSGFQGNQPCYQQEPHELSRLENYRNHHSQARQGYEVHSLETAATAAVGVGSKDCYGQPAYPRYTGGGGSAPAKKQYKGAKISGQPLPGGFGNRLGTAYSAQYMSEGHIQQKWEDPAHLTQYKQDMVGRLEVASRPGRNGPQYLEHSVQPISQSQCSHTPQPSAPVYTSHHQQILPQNASPSPLAYNQGHLHYPQHSQSLSSSTSSYMEKCSSVSHCYKGYTMGPNSQYSRPVGSSNSLKQSTYRSPNNYTYQQPSSRSTYEQQSSLQGMTNAQDSLSKYQHFSQQQQSYCLSDMSVRSPEHYYQNCSPSSGHSPARSVGRSPSYSSTPSPLMVNSETFQYNQPPLPIGSSSSAGLQEQGLLMPPHSHTSPSINHPKTNYTGSMKDRFSEKLLSNPSLWSLNALTSQVESISNNVQQLLLSEALVANKKSSKRSTTKKGEDFKGQMRSLEDSTCSDVQQASLVTEPFNTPQTQEGYSSSCEDQQDRSYYCCGQNRSPSQANANSQLVQEMVSSCSLTSPDEMLNMAEDCVPSLQIAQAGNNLNSVSWLQSGEAVVDVSVNASLKNMGKKSPQSIAIPTPQQPEFLADSQSPGDSFKENSEDSGWQEKQVQENKVMKKTSVSHCSDNVEVFNVSEQIEEKEQHQQQEKGWSENEKGPALLHVISKALTEKKHCGNTGDKLYQGMQNQCDPGEEDCVEKCGSLCNLSCRGDVDTDEKLMKTEMYASELPIDPDIPEKTMSFFWRDDFVQDQYLSIKEDNSELPQFNSRSELLEERLSTVEKETEEALEEQHSVPSYQPGELRKEKETLLPSEEVINNTIWSREAGKFCRLDEEQRDKVPAITEATAQENTLVRVERRSVACDIAPPTHSASTAFSALPEKATPPPQAREHIDRRDAEVLEPDSPQLPGKSILPSAPSWANTPPSPKKGDEDIEPGISCPSAVTPSIKPEPAAPTANIRLFNRKHGRGRKGQTGKQMQAGVRIRRHLIMEADAPMARQEVTLPSSESEIFPDHTCAAQKDISRQLPKCFAENFPSRMCTRSVSALTNPKAFLQLKRQLGPKVSEDGATKDCMGHPKDLITKIKWMRQKSPEQTAVDQVTCTESLTGSDQQHESQETALILPPLTKDLKAMVLRSRKPTQYNLLKETAKDKRAMTVFPKKIKETKKQKDALQNDKACLYPKQPQAGAHQRVYKSLTSKTGEKIVSPNKRKSNIYSMVPLKKHKGTQPETHQRKDPQLPAALAGVKGPKNKLRRGEHFKVSLSSYHTKENPLASNTSEIHSSPPQCPTKTKYLPPRKGRGLKYEAMVQKITSPGSKKHVSNPQVENVPIDLMSKTKQQDFEPKEMVKALEEKPGQNGSMWSIEAMTDGACTKTAIRKRKGLVTEGEEEPGPPKETSGAVVNMPRLAKQRAIKNNHEMHLKQRRKRRKGPTPAESTTSAEEPELPTAASAAAFTGKLASSTQMIIDGGVCRRGKCKALRTKKSQANALAKDGSRKQNILKKTGPKKRIRKSTKARKTTEMGPSTKAKQREQISPVAQQNQAPTPLKHALCKTTKKESRPLFCPYVHIDSSRSFGLHCTVVNRPEEELLLLQTKKKSPSKIKNSVSVAKAIANSSVMLQGPLVNKSLIDRCLTCCLCGKPANFRELGDLCGPYYPEDSIPRKALSFRYKLELQKDREKVSCSTVSASPLKREGALSCSGLASLGGATERPTRAERPSGESIMTRPTFRERYRKLQQLQGCNRKATDGGALTLFQRLQLEAEAKEHWAHEACAIWTGGVILVTGKLYGLKEAAHTAAETPCSRCQNVGASVSCCWKGCTQTFHYVCAKEMGCLLEEDNFSMKCIKHKVNMICLILLKARTCLGNH
uniref:Retinoic acid induced 1 n=1 Tax=Scleropages formosus TaxID=113540 RepID=A0A8C9SNP2_SCLFO